MKLGYFLLDDDRHFGARVPDGFLDLDIACRDYFATRPVKGANPSRFRSLTSFLEGGADSVKLANTIQDYIQSRRKEGWTPRAATGARFLFKAEEGVRYLPPILPGAKIFCMGVNSYSHAKESGREPPKRPFAFARFTNTLVGHEQPLLFQPVGQKPDVELELGVVIGKTGRRIPKEQALDHVAGFTVVHDLGYRDLQYPEPGAHPDWVMGKGLDMSLAVGPMIVARDEVPDAQGLKMTLTVNGVKRQEGSTDDYVFKVPEVIAHLSQGITLEAGDLIAMGSLGGTPGFEFGKPERILKASDVIEGTIDRVGTLKNVLAPEKVAAKPTPAAA
ncbi:MAG: fumarylacetoacetate hydrolase family protein [Euryarchaeota archaeon]|nr:fumarylacetoacetate hydrolase family protein [Euryarchaeota archaeon]MDE1835173.1 fumarylacetoacetate hydrolase family protein [Euryarchaeota archaeon]MDE1880416.1 fumarylacetoacetate hydrolase family protein [Euryarchaeota archaeon]MDE2045715.1 fumarylacetoacetate hydrolase family protein [Thermoplasmata archaeon]